MALEQEHRFVLMPRNFLIGLKKINNINNKTTQKLRPKVSPPKKVTNRIYLILFLFEKRKKYLIELKQ